MNKSMSMQVHDTRGTFPHNPKEQVQSVNCQHDQVTLISVMNVNMLSDFDQISENRSAQVGSNTTLLLRKCSPRDKFQIGYQTREKLVKNLSNIKM